MTATSRFSRFAWGVVAYNLLVIAWGAFVRATGSGAGCGSHWPLCNGEILPRQPRVETLIEFGHRASSGLALLLVVALVVLAFRTFPRGHMARRGAVIALVLIVIEALLGAGLVLFELVAENESIARALSMAAHLVNTFFLVGALSLTAAWGSSEDSPRFGRHTGAWLLWLVAAAVLLAGMSGAVAALGDTLYPSTSVAAGLRADISPTGHLLLRLRLLHPALALATAFFILVLSRRFVGEDTAPRQRGLSRWLVSLAILQLVAGLVNILLLAPVWLQLAHLLLADLLWICLVLLWNASRRLDASAPAVDTMT